MKKARIASMILCIAAAAIFAGFTNIFGGISIIVVNFEKYGDLGIALLISSFFLILGTVLACFEKFLLPLIFNIIGTAAYIYTVSGFYSIPNDLIPKASTEALAEKHLLTVIVTILLAALTFFNFFTDKNVKKRQNKKNRKYNKENRSLKDSEKIL